MNLTVHQHSKSLSSSEFLENAAEISYGGTAYSAKNAQDFRCANLGDAFLDAGISAVATPVRDGSHDFDFLYGKWNIHNHVLNKNPDGTSSWEEFDATNDCNGLPDGLGNQDYFRTDHWKGFVGMSIRLYDHDKGLWSIYWAENDQPGVIQSPPVVGSFRGNVGTFLVKHEKAGKPYMVRFIWTLLGDDTARWEQAVSRDDGKTWETGWIMDFTRGVR